MSYRYRVAEPFWTHFYRLNDAQKEAARRAWKIFKENPFDPRLRSHKIHRLSSLYGCTIFEDARQSRSVWTACVFSTAFGPRCTLQATLAGE